MFHPVKLKKARRTQGAKLLYAYTEVIIYPWGKKRRKKRRNKSPRHLFDQSPPRREKVTRSFDLEVIWSRRFSLPGDISRHCQNKFMSKFLQRSPSTGAIM